MGAADSNYSPRETIIQRPAVFAWHARGSWPARPWLHKRLDMLGQAGRNGAAMWRSEWARIDRLSEDSGNAR